MANLLANIRKRAREKSAASTARVDAESIIKRFPAFADYPGLSKASFDALKPAYTAYIADVSSGDMAVSLETAALLLTFANLLKPARVLDLGSGFSSYVLRSYARDAQHDVSVCSVDDNEHWLDKTRSYLQGHNLPVDDVLSWQDFKQQPPSSYDLIFHDLGSMQLRAEALGFVLGLRDKSGLVVLDDIHKHAYRRTAMAGVKQAGLSFYSSRQFTHDGIGRYAAIAVE